jgi:uncharacterized phage-associated protein
MAHVLDVAKYILERQGRISTLKLQKLVYYAQVWSLADHGEPLFNDAIKAWAQGPVVPTLFHAHKGRARIDASDLTTDGSGGLDDRERARIDRVLDYYGTLPASYLSRLTHHEKPWKEANATGERSGHKSPTISVPAIRSFYSRKRPEDLEADYQMSVARELMDQHAVALARLAL